MDAFRRIAPVRPAAAYIGGKKQLAARIVARIEAVAHRTYAEPFLGMGGVFLRRRFAPQYEVINDLSGDVATFFRILQRHYAPFMDMLKFQLTTRKDFERLNATGVDHECSCRSIFTLLISGYLPQITVGVPPLLQKNNAGS